ncbi:hypothetical protein C2H93_01925 [Bacillus subtilis]|nr:hypothetical protein C2H93_01925 [Bacillus subtilis]
MVIIESSSVYLGSLLLIFLKVIIENIRLLPIKGVHLKIKIFDIFNFFDNNILFLLFILI